MARVQFSSGGGGGVAEFILLTDTPSAYSVGTRGFLVAQNNTDDGVEFINPSTVGATTFTGLSDTPNSYGVGTRGFLIAQNNADTAVEFIDPTSLNSSFTFIALSDTPSTYSLQAQKVAVVSPSENGLIFTESLTASLDGQKIKFDVRDDTYGATGDHEGELLKIGTATQTQGNVLYWNGTDWADADASATSTATGLIAIAHTTTSPGTAGALHQGFVQLAANPGGSAGDVLYLSETAGGLTNTAPTTSGAVVRVMGYNIDGAGLIYFNPTTDWLEII